MSAAPISNIANAASNRKAAPHRKNAAQSNRSDSPYQQRTTQTENPTQQLIKQAVDYLIEQLNSGHSDMLAAYLRTMARFHSYSFGNILQIARQRPTANRRDRNICSRGSFNGDCDPLRARSPAASSGDLRSLFSYAFLSFIFEGPAGIRSSSAVSGARRTCQRRLGICRVYGLTPHTHGVAGDGGACSPAFFKVGPRVNSLRKVSIAEAK